MIDHQQVLDVWFGSGTDVNTIIGRQSGLWWGKDPAVDEDLRRRFEDDVRKLLENDSIPDELSPEQRLATIILVDQITRSIYRDTPRAFAGDPLALSLTRAGLDRGQDRQLPPLQRVFFYLPLEHAESLDCQEQSVRLFQALLNEVGPELAKPFQGYLDFALRHRDTIARFGRFPHRNRILGRESTPEELAFLEEPGSSF